jgi:hypothetical protein
MIIRNTRARSVTTALVVCLAVCSGIVPVLGAPLQKNRAPVITATPEHVTITWETTGSTKIQWNTGDGSRGFVFVTENDEQPFLFARGRRGSEVVSWIRTHRYVFELYGDNDRRRLLAKVTVFGSEPWWMTFPRHPVARWVLIVGLAAVFYFAFYFSATGPVRTTFPTEPTTSPRPLRVGRNLFLGIAVFIFLDAIIFHSGLYVSILAPDSYAGRVAENIRTEKQRATSGLKEVLVLGDSRIAEAFSTALADELAAPVGVKFVNFAAPGASANTWYYMVREVDPTARHYWAIVIPYGIAYEFTSADPLRISMTAPLLRYGDCFDFASGFRTWNSWFRAFTACILRGSAYQEDVPNLLEHPIERIRSLKKESERVRFRMAYQGQEYDLVGSSYDPTTGELTFSPKFTETQKAEIRKTLIHPSESEADFSFKLQQHWIPRIVNRYSNSPTRIVLTPVPRGPFRELPSFSLPRQFVFSGVTPSRPVLSIPEQTFDFLEKPDFYFDLFHLNTKGRRKFTESMVAELIHGLQSPDIAEHDSNRQ